MLVLVTGANGNLGRALFERAGDGRMFRAAVRSQRAAAQIERIALPARPEVALVDYASEPSMREALRGCDAVVHLVGILKEAKGASYEAAHEESCGVLARAAAATEGVRRIVYLSIVGSHPSSPNACLASKGRAERTLLEGRVPATVLRVPMVLARGDYATAALRREASSERARLVGGGRTLQQPIDARDVVDAILAALRDESGEPVALDLAGPECLPHRELVARAARVLGRSAPRISSIALPAARAFAAAAGALLPNPPITSAMLGVLQHDDRVDTKPACERLGLRLTSLDETLAHCLRDADGAPASETR